MGQIAEEKQACRAQKQLVIKLQAELAAAERSPPQKRSKDNATTSPRKRQRLDDVVPESQPSLFTIRQSRPSANIQPSVPLFDEDEADIEPSAQRPGKENSFSEVVTINSEGDEDDEVEADFSIQQYDARDYSRPHVSHHHANLQRTASSDKFLPPPVAKPRASTTLGLPTSLQTSKSLAIGPKSRIRTTKR